MASAFASAVIQKLAARLIGQDPRPVVSLKRGSKWGLILDIYEADGLNFPSIKKA